MAPRWATRAGVAAALAVAGCWALPAVAQAAGQWVALSQAELEPCRAEIVELAARIAVDNNETLQNASQCQRPDDPYCAQLRQELDQMRRDPLGWFTTAYNDCGDASCRWIDYFDGRTHYGPVKPEDYHWVIQRHREMAGKPRPALSPRATVASGWEAIEGALYSGADVAQHCLATQWVAKSNAAAGATATPQAVATQPAPAQGAPALAASAPAEQQWTPLPPRTGTAQATMLETKSLVELLGHTVTMVLDTPGREMFIFDVMREGLNVPVAVAGTVSDNKNFVWFTTVLSSQAPTDAAALLDLLKLNQRIAPAQIIVAPTGEMMLQISLPNDGVNSALAAYFINMLVDSLMENFTVPGN